MEINDKRIINEDLLLKIGFKKDFDPENANFFYILNYKGKYDDFYSELIIYKVNEYYHCDEFALKFLYMFEIKLFYFLLTGIEL